MKSDKKPRVRLGRVMVFVAWTGRSENLKPLDLSAKAVMGEIKII